MNPNIIVAASGLCPGPPRAKPCGRLKGMNSSIDRIDRVESWMVAYMADLLDIPEHEVDVTRPFDHFGLDSVAAVVFASDLEKWLGIDLDTSLMIENENIQLVVQYIRENHGERAHG